jgi:hypothetical protein
MLRSLGVLPQLLVRVAFPANILRFRHELVRLGVTSARIKLVNVSIFVLDVNTAASFI